MKVFWSVFVISLLSFAQDPSLARRRQALDDTLRILPKSSTRITGRINATDKSWEDWQRRTGELPPDFEAMPSIPLLPDSLADVKTASDWQARKRLIREQYQQWIIGRMPPAPGNLRAEITGEHQEGGVTVRDVLLAFGPNHAARLRVQLMIPPGKGPFPVFLTNHPRTRPWVATAVRRGYIGAIYYAADPIYGNDDDSDKFIEVYPEYDWSCLARWAWAGMRAVDYLYTLPQVNRAQIGISGHSRNGKQALIAAAFDDRIGAAVPSSGNTGEGSPWRYTTDMFAAESLEQITGNFPHWFHPRLRFFAGREQKLPVDQNSLMALVAPRGLMLASSFSESQGNAFGFEQAYRASQKVYQFLGKAGNLGLYLRAGDHPTTAEDIERYVDFFDSVFGRRQFPPFENWLHGYTFDGWRKLSGESAPDTAALRRKSFHDRMQWVLGDEPGGVTFPARHEARGRVMTTEGWLGGFYRRPLQDASLEAVPLAFGDDLKADLYLPKNAPGKLPVVIWLHEYSYSTGYSRYRKPFIIALAQRGYAVLAFDQIGFGSRAEQAARFYARYPHWSLLGKMVTDTRAAVDAVSALENIDATRVYLVGYALGGKVGLFTAALEPRVRGVAAVAAFTPLRSSAGSGTEGIRHYSHLHGLLPRLGFYLDKETELPFDYDELLTSYGGRPILLIAPQLDRYAVPADVQRVTNGKAAVSMMTPREFNSFSRADQESVISWIEKISK